MPTESDDFLKLLCGVFGLDIGRARSVFFQEPMYDINRKWGLFENDTLVSVLSTTPLEFGWGNAIGIAGVATDPSRRNRGLASALLNEVRRTAIEEGEGTVFLFASRPEIYQRAGYAIIDEAVRGSLRTLPRTTKTKSLSFSEVQTLYRQWCDQNPNRLRRNDRRWKLWQWNLKFCTQFNQGYLALEGSMVREALFPHPDGAPWSVPAGTDWFGLKSMTELLKVPLQSEKRELYLMGLGTDLPPQMFLTDQF